MGSEAHRPLAEDFWGVMEQEVAWMHRQLRRLGVREAELDDVLQEALVQLHLRRELYDGARPLRPFLFGFLFRVASDHRRRAVNRYESVGVSSEPREPRASPEQALEQREDLALVQRALDRLPEGRREVFVMAVIEEFPVTEVAEALEIPLNTAYSRLRIAKREFVEAVRRLRLHAR